MRGPPNLALLACGVLLAACELPPPDAQGTIDSGGPPPVDSGVPSADGGALADGGAARPFSIVVLPDTQFYASSYPEIFDRQADWIVANRNVLNIAFVMHSGDIVDYDEGNQWANAARSLHRLDRVVPYFLAPGNHDYGSAQRGTMMSSFFPPAAFAGYPWFGGTFEPGRIENNWGIVTVASGRWLVIALEFGPRAQVLEWAGALLDAHADVPAMLVTHAYLYRDGTRYDKATRPDQFWNPHDYGMDGLPGGVNDGEQMWRALVSRHDNLKYVLSGHVLPADPDTQIGAAARLTSVRASGSRCHQILANYQTCPFAPCEQVMGGDGYLRVLTLDPATNRMSVRTYSPYLDQSLSDDANQFELEAN